MQTHTPTLGLVGLRLRSKKGVFQNECYGAAELQCVQLVQLSFLILHILVSECFTRIEYKVVNVEKKIFHRYKENVKK